MNHHRHIILISSSFLYLEGFIREERGEEILWDTMRIGEGNATGIMGGNISIAFNVCVSQEKTKDYQGEEHSEVNAEAARAFAAFITSPETQDLIRKFGVEEYGEPLFVPDAAAVEGATPAP